MHCGAQAKLLPVLRKTLGLPRLDYVSVQNQGDFLIEVPADRQDIPRVRVTPLMSVLAVLCLETALLLV